MGVRHIQGLNADPSDVSKPSSLLPLQNIQNRIMSVYLPAGLRSPEDACKN